MSKRSHVQDLRGASRLAIDAVKGVTDLVQAMHRTIGAGPAILGRPLDGVTHLVTAPVYGSIRAVTTLVGASIDLALAQLAPLLGESAPRPEHEAILAAVNGVLGDYLQDTQNPLAIAMRLRRDGAPLVIEKEALRRALPDARAKVLVLVHGSCMNDLQWTRRGHDRAAALARDLGYTPVHLQYNSGLHVSTNGRAFAALLEQLVDAWPTQVDAIAFVGHSMGGLVSRSACRYGELAQHAWRRKVRALITLGTPHHGAPLERAGNWVDVLLGLTPYSAPLARLGKIRSAGVTDLRFGNVVDEDWEGRGRFDRGGDCRASIGLPEGVACYAIAASTSRAPCAKPAGDGLVPVESALGRCASPERTLRYPEDHLWVAFGAGHLDLLDRDEVYAKIRTWLEDASGR